MPYKRAPVSVLVGVGLSFVHQAVVIAVVFLNARALALDVPFAAVAVFVPLVSLAGMVPVSVNGLGVREALYILLFGRIGVPVETAVSLALLYLAVTFLASLPGGLAYVMQPARARDVDERTDRYGFLIRRHDQPNSPHPASAHGIRRRRRRQSRRLQRRAQPHRFHRRHRRLRRPGTRRRRRARARCAARSRPTSPRARAPPTG